MGRVGAIGHNVDGVFYWRETASVQRSLACRQKQGYPALPFEAAVDEHLWFVSVTKSHEDSRYDDPITSFDVNSGDVDDAPLFRHATIEPYVRGHYHLSSMRGVI